MLCDCLALCAIAMLFVGRCWNLMLFVLVAVLFVCCFSFVGCVADFVLVFCYFVWIALLTCCWLCVVYSQMRFSYGCLLCACW